MKSRERKYLREQWLWKMMLRISKVNNMGYTDLFFYGMIGAENIILSDGTISQRQLTIAEMMELKDKVDFKAITPQSYDGEIYKNFHIDEFGQWAAIKEQK